MGFDKNTYETSRFAAPKPEPTANVQSESLVVIRTFGDLIQADEAQVALMTAGIYALIFTDESVSLRPDLPPGQGIALAVHQRDMMLAEQALFAVTPHP